MIIDVDAQVALACRRFGMADPKLGELELEGLRIFARDAIKSAERNRLSPAPAADWVRNWILNHFMLEARIRERPELLATPVERPIFIVAAPRTGSTLLQRLLALEPSFRSPKLWELWHPFHPRGNGLEAHYIETTHQLLKRWPEPALHLHPMAPEEPEECQWLIKHSPVRASLHLAFEYWEWLKALDRPALLGLYQGYRRQVQVMQADAPGRRWLSKTFAHMHYWSVLFDVFPDAQVVRLHRDPVESLASSCGLIQALGRGGDRVSIGDIALDTLDDALHRTAAISPRQSQILDIDYVELASLAPHLTAALALFLDAARLPKLVDAYLQDGAIAQFKGRKPLLDEFNLDAGDILGRLSNHKGKTDR